MLANFHTHTSFCDGDNTPEEVVRYAIDNKFDAIGFSAHGYTPFDLQYCIKEIDKYIETINNLKQKYQDKIQIYLGFEEDAFSYTDRDRVDYIIGSSHYFLINGRYYPIDSSHEGFKKCLDAFDYDIIRLSSWYYEAFCRYIKERQPDIVGHFDLITKFDELETPLFLSDNSYLEIADKYIEKALENDVIFEVNTGAISRGIRTAPYPHERLLHKISKTGGKIILSSDSHTADTLCAFFEEAKTLLKGIGFKYIYSLYDNKFKKYAI